MTPSATHFASAAEFRGWLLANHATAAELWVGFYKKNSGKGGLTYAEAVDEVLCFGWIDGVVKKTGDDSFTHRCTPRRLGSIWSNVNVRHVARLTAAGRMHASGIKAFEARKDHKTGIYNYEQPEPSRPTRPPTFPAALEKTFRANRRAWLFWSELPPGYQRTAIWWVISAKQDATRQRRLGTLITGYAAGRRVAEASGNPRGPKSSG